ncbi:MAG: hypothetical protein M1816_005945 [Peltula sp. TS41687]|nr:MAG: hypothetical protein M1816_005945 [Peltula sp. TS41687]
MDQPPLAEPETPDYYRDLGLRREATIQEIKVNFRKLAKLYHPDKMAPGAQMDAEDFRKVRKAYEILCDEAQRRRYDQMYTTVQEQWAEYRRLQEAQRVREWLERAEDKRRRTRAAEDGAGGAAEAERARKAAEEERLAAEKRARETSRRFREWMAEERSREAGRRAREKQEQAAQERLRKQMEDMAEERSRAAAKRAREEQEKAARERLAETLMRERQQAFQKNWADMRRQAEQDHSEPTGAKRQPSPGCAHPQLGWPRKNGSASYIAHTG